MNQPLDPTRASSAEAALREGRLNDALEALQADIRKKPQDKALRVFLFQLLAVTGAWERALRQLNVLVEMDAQYALLAQAYRPLIACEVFRAELFQGARSPSSLGEPLPWFGALIRSGAADLGRAACGGAGAARQSLRRGGRGAGQDRRQAVRLDLRCRSTPWPGARGHPAGPLLLGAVRTHPQDRVRAGGGSA